MHENRINAFFFSNNIETLKAVTLFAMIYGTTLICASIFFVLVYQILKHCGIKWVQPHPTAKADNPLNTDSGNEREPLEKTEA